MEKRLLIVIFLLIFSCGRPDYSTHHGNLPFVEGEIIVKFKEGVKKSQTEFLHRTMGVSVIRSLRLKEYLIERIKLPQGMTVEDAIRTYENLPEVEYAEPNYIVKKAETIPDDPYFNNQWALHNTGQSIDGFSGTPDADIDAPEAWTCTGNAGIVVAIVDTGVDYNHPDLKDNIWINSGETCNDGLDNDGNGYVDDCTGWDFVNNDNDPMDDDVDGHGTHVAGIIGAAGNNGEGVSGVNWSVKIMPLKFLDSKGSGTLYDAIEAIKYAVKMGARVINASYTYPQACVKITPSLIERDAIKAAGDAGVLFIAAAGNYGCNNDQTPFYPASHKLQNIISVTASDMNDKRPWWSNYGARSVHVTSPGLSIYSTVRTDLKGYNNIYGYDFMSGTSMAAPHVSGLSALLMDCKDLTHLEVRELILTTVDQKNDFIDKTISGGRINAFNAMNSPLIPVRPSGLEASISLNSVILKWQDNSSFEDGFKVERKDGSESSYYEIATVQSNANTYIDQDASLVEGRIYYYRLRAYNSNGYSLYSNEAGISIPPNAPSGLKATAISSSEVRLTWQDNSSVENGYVIERRSESGSWSQIGVAGADATGYVDRGLNPSTIYYYRIKAYGRTGESPYSSEVSVKTNETSSGDINCFIATAVYGTPLAPEIEVLRKFRDRYLITNAPGRLFVRFYYAVSPSIAEVIKNHKGLKFVTRIMLTPLVYMTKYPEIAVAIIFIFTIALFVRKKKRFL